MTASPVLDQSANLAWTGSNPAYLTLTVNHADEIIVVNSATCQPNTTDVITGVTSTGQVLTWYNRSSYGLTSGNGGGYLHTETWWAHAPLAANITIAVAYTNTPASGVLIAFGVTGAYLAAPFDPAGPVSANNPSGYTTEPTVTGFNTIRADVFPFIFAADNYGSLSDTPSPSWSRLQGNSAGSGGDHINQTTWGSSVTGPISNQTVTLTSENDSYWIVTVDALTADMPTSAAVASKLASVTENAEASMQFTSAAVASKLASVTENAEASMQFTSAAVASKLASVTENAEASMQFTGHIASKLSLFAQHAFKEQEGKSSTAAGWVVGP